MITLFGIELPEVVKPNELQNSSVLATSVLTRNGVSHLWTTKKEEVPMDLLGGEDNAWISRAIYKELFELSESIPGWGVLIYEGISYSVRFRHEDSPAVFAIPLRAVVDHGDGDYYKSLRIRLIREVE